MAAVVEREHAIPLGERAVAAGEVDVRGDTESVEQHHRGSAAWTGELAQLDPSGRQRDRSSLSDRGGDHRHAIGTVGRVRYAVSALSSWTRNSPFGAS